MRLDTPATRLPWAVRAYAKRLIQRHPALFFPIYRRTQYAGGLVQPDSRVVIEGFPRSANTYMLYAFAYAQRGKVTPAGHVHGAAQIVRAVQLQIPVIVLIRKPEDAIRSWVVYLRGQGDVKSHLADYIAFYETVLPVVQDCLIADFQEVVTDAGSVIRRLNAKYGTAFSDYVKTDASEDAIRHALEKRNGARGYQLGFLPDARKEELKQSVDFSEHSVLVKRANLLYKQILAFGGE